MRVHQMDQQTLRLRSGNVSGVVVGIIVAVVGTVFATAIAVPIFIGHRDSEYMSTPYWVLLAPVVFLVVGLSMAGMTQRITVDLRRYGSSKAVQSRFLGLNKQEETFDAVQGHHLGLHTDERIRRTKNGTRRERISTICLVLRDGTEVLLAKESRSGIGGRQPLVGEAERISQFLDQPLERTGYGAPPGVGEGPLVGGGTAGRPGQQATPSQSPGLPDWVRGEGDRR